MCVNVVLIRLFFPPLSVFDDEDENKLSYTDIHIQYKKLVSAIFYLFIYFWPCQLCLLQSVLLSHGAPSTLLISGVWIAHSSTRANVSCFAFVGGEAVR